MHKIASFLMVTTCAAVLLTGTAHAEEKKAQAAAKPAKDFVILEVDGDKIKNSEVQLLWKTLFPEGQAPEFDRFDEKVRLNVLRGVASEHALYKRAKADGLENNAKIKEMLERLKRKFITQEYMERQVNAGVTDTAVKKEYDRRSGELKGKQEVHARHILVKTEDEAKAIKEQLDDDANFEKLAREKSEDKASGANGGDLGYFQEGEMVEAFTKAAFALDKGEVSDPVKSEYGWHIIKVEDKRDAKLPPFEEMEAQIREELKAKALSGFIQDVLDSTSVKYFSPEGKTLEFSKTPEKESEGAR